MEDICNRIRIAFPEAPERAIMLFASAIYDEKKYRAIRTRRKPVKGKSIMAMLDLNSNQLKKLK